MKRFDLAFIGLGAAAMSMAVRLYRSGWAGRAVFIEAKARPEDDRTWCGWGPSAHPFADQIARQWTRWAVSHAGETVISSDPGLPYEMLRARDVRQTARCAILARNDWCLMDGRSVRSAIQTGGNWALTLDNGGVINADWVLDARPPAITLKRPWVWQSFVGFELTADGPGCDDTVRLMDFIDSDGPLVTFLYELPIASGRRLVELTRFTPERSDIEQLRARLRALLAARGWRNISILREETGHLPMAPIRPYADNRWVRIGAAGGSLRPATGYAFHAIQHWADDCTASIINGREPVAPRRVGWLDWVDGVFLDHLWHHAEDRETLFMRLFHQTSPGSLARFLMARPTARDLWEVARALPAFPMLNAAWRHGWRRY